MSVDARAGIAGELAGLDEPVRAFFERIAGPAAAASPELATIGAALLDLVGRAPR